MNRLACPPNKFRTVSVNSLLINGVSGSASVIDASVQMLAALVALEEGEVLTSLDLLS